MDSFDEDSQSEQPFYDKSFQEIEGGYIDDRGFYTTPNGSFWDENHNYFNHLGFDSHGGMYDKYGVYIPGPDYDDDNELYKDQKDFIFSEKLDKEKHIDYSISKLIEQEKIDEKIIKKFGNLEEESEISDEDEDNISLDDEDFKEAYKDVLDKEIELYEILNPEVYTGIIERDFHLYVYKPKKQPEYVHIGESEKPICTCKMHNKDIDINSEEICVHIKFILNDLLHLNFSKENIVFKGDELKKAFKKVESNNPDIIRETYGIVKRKNFDFPSPKIYKYDISKKDAKDEKKVDEWRVKERLYARGIIADEFMFPGLTYSFVENTYDKYFYCDKNAKPTKKAYEKPHLSGRQLELDKIYNNLIDLEK